MASGPHGGTNARLTDSGTRRHIGSLIRRAQQRHLALWSARVSPRISSVQYAALEGVAAMPGGSQRDLGEELGLDRSTIADLVRRMESAGLLKRRRDDEDRRRNTLELTPLGRAELERLSPLVDAVQVELVETLEAAEVRTLRELLLRVIG